MAAALVGSGVVWAVHLLTSYAVVVFGCATGWVGTGPLLGMLTVVCMALALGTGAAAYRARRSVPVSPETRSPYSGVAPARFALAVGSGLAVLFAVLIALGGLIPFVLPLCAVSS